MKARPTTCPRTNFFFRLSGIVFVCALSFLPSIPAQCANFDDLIQTLTGFKSGSGGDFNGDGMIDHLDVFQLALEWRETVFIGS